MDAVAALGDSEKNDIARRREFEIHWERKGGGPIAGGSKKIDLKRREEEWEGSALEGRVIKRVNMSEWLVCTGKKKERKKARHGGERHRIDATLKPFLHLLRRHVIIICAS